MFEPEEGPSRIQLRPEGPRPPREREVNQPVYTPGPSVRYQHQVLVTYLRRISEAVRRTVDAQPAEEQKAQPWKELGNLAEDTRVALTDFERVETRHRLEAEKLADAAPVTYEGGLTEWLIPHNSGTRPTTDNPLAVVLLDYVDNLRTDALAFIKAAITLSGQGIRGRSEASRWQHYERLSELFRHVDSLIQVVKETHGLATEWDLKVPGLRKWIDVTARYLEHENEQVRSAMVRARGPLLP